MPVQRAAILPTFKTTDCTRLMVAIPLASRYWWNWSRRQTLSFRRNNFDFFFLSFYSNENWSMLDYIKKTVALSFFSDLLLFVFVEMRYTELNSKKNTFTNRHVITFKTLTFNTKKKICVLPLTFICSFFIS